ncbi:hypothetical protein Btru_042081 [Bulinus truncatus]|nr:hypothetical protein Btru_042081 [Bulinus truncatus]
MLLVVPSFQQPSGGYIGGLVGNINQGNCYNRCYSAYQKNPNNYLVNGCVCTQYQFTGVDPNARNVCGYLDNTCLANQGEYDSVFAYTFDLTSQRCQKVSVYNRCVGSHGVSSNIFQTLQECTRSCEFVNRRY